MSNNQTFSLGDGDLLVRADQTKADFAKVPAGQHTKVLRGIVEAADVMLGICWEAGRLRSHIIKGELKLEEISRTGAAEVCLRVIYVREIEEAEAMRRVFGDGARLH